MHAASLQSVLDNYDMLFGVWSEALSLRLDGEMKARVIGVDTQTHTFDFLFGISLGSLLLCHTDNLSKSLQQKSLSAAEGQRLAKLTLDVLRSLRDDDHFASFYARVLQDQIRFRVDAPTLPRKRKAPKRFLVGTQMVISTRLLKIFTGRYIMKHWILLLKLSVTDSTSLGIAYIRIWRS